LRVLAKGLGFFGWFCGAAAFLIGLFAICFAVYECSWFQKKFVYPFPYQETVYRQAIENEIDPFLIAGVIRTESRFMPAARSPKGAIGLMQIMPETAIWVAGQLGFENFDVSQLQDPETNIRFGTWYLALLHREFYGNETLALAAYNGGCGNVRQWMRQYNWTSSFSDINQIPFRETREYVAKVQKSKQRYQELYGQ